MAKTPSLRLFSEVAGAWKPDHLATFLSNAAKFLVAYESELDSAVRRKLVEQAVRDLDPLLLSMREEPRQTIREQLRVLAQSKPELVNSASVALFQRTKDALPPEDANEVLALLASVNFIYGEHIAMLALERLSNIPEWRPYAASMGEMAICLAGGSAGAMSALGIANRLAATGLLTWDAAEATLHMVASTQPSKIALALRHMINVTTASSDIGDHEVAAAIEEAIERSDAMIFLAGLLDLELEISRELLRAAFSPPRRAPFELINLMINETSGARLCALYRGVTIDLSQLQPASAAARGFGDWQRTLRNILGYSPRMVRQSEILSSNVERGRGGPITLPFTEGLMTLLQPPTGRPN